MKAQKVVQTIALCVCALLMAGCASRGEIPIAALRYENPVRPAVGEKKLLIFLRGVGGDHSIFKGKGLVDQVIDRGLPFDMVAPDAHFGYYQDETLGRRLYEDIIVPARQQGYTQIWVAGTSMGGMGALFLLIEHPEAVDGVILLSPFLGWPGIVSEVRDAGGLERWEPGAHTVEDWQRYLWSWVKHHREQGTRVPPIYLGYGASDFFTYSQDLLAQALPEGHTTVIEGGHTYGTLTRLWRALLDKLEPELQARKSALPIP